MYLTFAGYSIMSNISINNNIVVHNTHTHTHTHEICIGGNTNNCRTRISADVYKLINKLHSNIKCDGNDHKTDASLLICTLFTCAVTV